MGKISYTGRLPHLDLLRGFAILFIVLFHFHTASFCNGFYGVEIFLVISGFLLANSHLKNGTPPFLSYINKKVIRIFPALSVCLIISTLFAPVLCPDNRELLDCFRTSGYTILAYSHVFLDRNHDYFSPNAIFNPLLHTWYISVTVQVYLLYIIYATLTKKISSRINLIILAVIAVLSFCDSLGIRFFPLNYIHSFDADSAYYSVFSRLWEFIAGGIVFLLPDIPNVNVKRLISHLSLLTLLILVCIPTAYACSVSIPVIILTILLIKYADISFYGKWISSPLLQLGKISFSVYLIHYPIIVFCDNLSFRNMNTAFYPAVVTIILIMGIIVYKAVEQRRFPTWVAILLAGMTLGYSILLTKNEDIREAVPNLFAQYRPYYPDTTPVSPHLLNHLNTSAIQADNGITAIHHHAYYNIIMPIGNRQIEPSFVLIGDSNAQHLYAGMDTVLQDAPISGVYLCARIYAFMGQSSTDGTCREEKIRAFLLWLEQQPQLQTVVISQLWPSHFKAGFVDWGTNITHKSAAKTEAALERFCDEVIRRGKHVVIVAPLPIWEKQESLKPLAYLRIAKLRGCDLPQDLFSITPEEYQKKSAVAISAFNHLETKKKARILWTESASFPDGKPFYAISPGSHQVLLLDSTHFAPAGSILLFRRLKEDLIRILSPSSDSLREE